MGEFRNPWLALKAYDESQCTSFKGRDQDTTNIVTLLQQNDCVVCYAASGDGKSSLINAGVCPQIRKLGMFPIRIVFNEDDYHNREINFDETVLKKIELRLAEFAKKRQQKEQEFEVGFEKNPEYKDIDIPNSLWWKLRTETIQITYGEYDYIPVLIFDQFEEFFLRASWKDKFFRWLEELSRDVCPDYVIDRIKEKPLDTPSKKLFKMLFSLRYEYVGELDYWCSQRYYIPQMMRNRYYLKPLTRAQAIEIIQEQGAEGDTTANKMKLDCENIVDRIISSSAHSETSGDEISATILALSCHVLYKEGENYETSSLNNLDNLIFQYYLDQMEDFGLLEDDRHVLEDVLLTPKGTRLRIPTSDSRLQKIEIDRLLYEGHDLCSTNLFHKEETGKKNDGFQEYYIEFAHDKLAEAIIRNKPKHSIKASTKKTLLQCSIVLILIIICCIFSYKSIIPDGFDPSIRRLDYEEHPIHLTKDDVFGGLQDYEFLQATSLKLDRNGICQHKMDCYRNVLEWNYEKDGGRCYGVMYAHNAKSISFLDDLPTSLSFTFGPNTQTVYLLPSKTQLLEEIGSISCENKNTIIYIPYGCLETCQNNKNNAFANVSVHELSASATFAKRLIYNSHMYHSHIGNDQDSVSIPFWILFILSIILTSLILFSIRNHISVIAKKRKWLFAILLVISIIVFWIICFSAIIRGKGLKYDVAYVNLALLFVFLVFLFIEKRNSSKAKTTVKRKRSLCAIIYNSKEYKNYAITLKQLLIENGLTDSDINLDLGIISPNGFNYETALNNLLHTKHVIPIINVEDIQQSHINDDYFKLLRRLHNIHPVFADSKTIDDSAIPQKLKTIISNRKQGTIRASQALSFDFNNPDPLIINYLINSIKRDTSIVRIKYNTIMCILSLCFYLSLFILWDTNYEWVSLLVYVVFCAGWVLFLLYYSGRIDFPRLKRFLSKRKERKARRKERRRQKREKGGSLE